ncbi:hypothetical protein AB7828_06525 [Tardiphaga sp. 215_C5_N2_1]|uniref:hypothetical protein n=1 Tax=Tardiphaga sp. 215_C5_N2_1 TaxID=3240774 RepID=UPI003F8B17B4
MVEPQELVTWPCLDYIFRVNEINNFASFFFGIVGSRDAIAGAMTQESCERFALEADKYSEESTSLDRQMVQQMLLSRMVESFNHYVTSMLGDIFLSRPEMLSADGDVKIGKILELRTFDEIVRHLVEKRVNEISYSSLSDLRKYIRQRTNIDLYRDDEQFAVVLLATEVRNLIAHNDCIVNDIFLRKTNLTMTDLPLSETGRYRITDEWLHQVIDCLASVVFAFDDAAAKKFDLAVRNRFHTFVMRI